MNDDITLDETVESWVLSKCQDWRDHYESNYSEKHDEYYRLWRGIWAPEDQMRKSERSRIISPALQQAVESSVAEIEEATFGRGKWFDIADDIDDEDNSDVQYIRTKLTEDFAKRGVKRDIAECLLNAAVFGNGIAEIVMEEVKEQTPATQPILDGQLTAVGVNIQDRTVVGMRPIMPKNFLIDPVAVNIKDALGCATDEFVSQHSVDILIEEGIYRDEEITSAATQTEIEPDEDLAAFTEDKVRLTKYYGLVPRDLLEKAMKEDPDDEDITEGDSYYVEAIIVIANEGTLLKAEENPYMMQDRPIVAFQWDITPGLFWGRGICEKGYNSQKALDTEIRARIDALALTVHPMMAIDATRLPRGHKPEIRPGKMLLTNGDPREVLHPFNFGQVSQITFAQAAELQKMVQMATGAVDSAGMAGSVNGEATAAGISMSLGAIIKRQKRTLISFQESFLIPFVEKAAWRYMQFDPERYPAKDYKFNVTSSLGIMAREYEVTQLVQLLQTTSPDSAIYPTLVQSIIENMNLSNREDIIKQIVDSSKPTEEQQAQQQAQMKMEQENHQAQIGAIQGQANESNARANKYTAEAQAVPATLEIKKLEAITTNLKDGDKDDIEFERRYKIAEMMLKEKDLNIREQDSKLKHKTDLRNATANDTLRQSLNG
jgi:hypothetical protein